MWCWGLHGVLGVPGLHLEVLEGDYVVLMSQLLLLPQPYWSYLSPHLVPTSPPQTHGHLTTVTPTFTIWEGD